MKNILTNFFNGECYDAYKYFGAHPYKGGYVFRVFAPLALEVELIGDFNKWNGKRHKMKKIDDRGIYEIHTKKINSDYQLYRYRIKTKRENWIEKSDPYAFFSELRPNTASKTIDLSNFVFDDNTWMENRTKGKNSPLNIYEVHLVRPGCSRQDHQSPP